MQESHLLRHIFARSADLTREGGFPSILVGPGDDCAVVITPRGDHLLLKVDQIVERRHFLSGTPIHLIARKAIARAISDIAAMGGSPCWGLASGILPPDYPQGDDLFDRLAHWARHWHAPLVGGDIATGAPGCMLSLSITIIGIPHPTRGPVLRSTAMPGDELWVTGRIGGSLASQHHLTFEPRLAEARDLCGTLGDKLTAMIDISDGLGRDAGRIADTSGVRIIIEGARIPLGEGATDIAKAAADGEDYELLFTTAPGALNQSELSHLPAPITRIGRVEEGSGCTLVLPGGHEQDASTMGWDH